MDTRPTLLIVDDDPMLVKTMSDIFEASGYISLTAPDGKTALEQIARQAPDVALIDLKLPDISGLEVLKKIKELAPKTECILLTGFASQESAIKAVNLEAYGYLLKPYDMDQVLLTIRRALEKQSVEATLKESELYFNSILNSLSEDIMVIDRDHRISDVNEAFVRTSGRSREEVLEHHCYEISHGYDNPCYERGRDCHLLNVFETGEPRRFRHRHKRADSSTFYVDIQLSPLKDEEGNVTKVIEATRDLTELFEAQEAQRSIEERMQLAVRGADLGTWDWNFETGDVTFNDRWTEMLEYAPHEIEPNLSSWEKLVHPEDLPGVMKVLKAHLEGETDFYETEHRLKAKSGRWVWVLDKGRVIEREAGGKPSRVCGTHLDISERKAAEEELDRYHNHLEADVDKRTGELQKVVNLMTGRELRMAELKKIITKLRAQLDEAGISPATGSPHRPFKDGD